MKTHHKIIACVLLLTVFALMSACVPGTGSNSPEKPAGFFAGVWHGWIAPFALVYSLFNKTANIYEAYNTGFGYNIGFYMAIISGFGGLALGRKKRRD